MKRARRRRRGRTKHWKRIAAFHFEASRAHSEAARVYRVRADATRARRPELIYSKALQERNIEIENFYRERCEEHTRFAAEELARSRPA